ncbi:MAG: DUF4010 domain-containing protein [Dyella sp.]
METSLALRLNVAGANVDDSAGIVIGLGVALGSGLLLGLERERAKRGGPLRGQAGVRTFALLGLAGAVAALLGDAAIYVGGAFVALAMVVSYRHTRQRDPGLTTEVAMLLTYLLGMLAMSHASLSAGLAVVVAILLASKARLHRLSKQWLSAEELHDLLILAAAAFVVLPLLPDRPIDPWQALNPRRLWMLAVAVMAIASLGYLALRGLGARFGLMVAGLAGGFVSSTATIAGMGERARAAPAVAAAAASAAVISNVGTVVQLAVVIGALSRPLLSYLMWPLVVAGALAIVAALLGSWRVRVAPMDARALVGERPFKLASVLRFVALLAGIVTLSAIIRAQLGAGSFPWVMALSGLADVHAAAASAAQAQNSAQIALAPAAQGVLIALLSNSTLKCVLAALKGGRAYALRVTPGVLAMVAGFALMLWMI